LAGVQFCFTLGSYGIGIWLPQIVKTYKFSNTEVSLIVAVPYLFASIAMIAWAWHIDRTGKKVGNLAIACFLGAVGLVVSVLLTGSLLVALAGLTVALVGVTSARAIFWNVPTRFLTGIAAAGGLAFINTIGVFGGFVGPSMMGWLKDWTGSFTAGLIAMAGIMLVATLLAASLKLIIKQE
ncbi:MAG: MFS transporter, partial [Bradyrhizobium sp.]